VLFGLASGAKLCAAVMDNFFGKQFRRRIKAKDKIVS
jgi:hypothetical protein